MLNSPGLPADSLNVRLSQPKPRAAREGAALFWVVRWTDAKTDHDMAMVVEAPTRADAEAVAAEQGIPYLFVARASQSDIADARIARLAQGAASVARYTVLGRPLGRGQLAALLLLGVATALLHLRPILSAIVT